ncbi:hypothetical protein FPOAC2_04239 [Fusarium poae]|uniref:hypothetical protein n=1 Tax=Fusarium poae TaxID=36050 RepID=UPI001CE7678A|nr:hypothetical protein FPOAC1_004184 [Fusarium poae]KAG8670949.1 hypothetical protein FPOAC1_004184 [Fusarium poae]
MSLTSPQLPLPQRHASELLCEKCRGMPWDIFNEPYVMPTVKHHRTFSELQSSCDQGCPLCQNIRVTLVYDGVDLATDDPVPWSISEDRSIDPKSKRPRYRKRPKYDMLDDRRTKSPGQTLPTIRRLAPDTLEDDLEILLENINQWLTACTISGKHEKCTLLDSCTTSSLPTRLIDVGTQDKDILRLIESQTEYPRDGMKPLYSILSYRWGEGNRSARTTQNNMEQRKKKMDLREFPKTIRDAIEITRRMKIRYLWVDAVCIIQPDNDGETEDWMKESANMATYYSNSYICIAASSAEDSSEGILIERKVAKFPFREWCDPDGRPIKSPHDSRRIFRNPLLERGWCLQEWLLSPRILHWTKNGLIWQCRHGFFWEGQKDFCEEGPERISGHSGIPSRFINDCPFKMGLSDQASTSISHILESTKNHALGYHWSYLIQSYNQMNLTKPEDRLAAIHGIATCLSNRHKVGYFAGIFEHKTMNGLLWSKAPNAERLTKIEGFPSWSWASAKGNGFIPYVENEDTTLWMRWIGGFPSSNKIQDFKKRLNRQIHIAAPLLPLPLGRVFQENSPDDEKLFKFGANSPIWPGRRLGISLDYSESDLVYLEGACLLFLCECRFPMIDRIQIDGLVVKRSSNDGDNVYKRIGKFDIQLVHRVVGLEKVDTRCLEDWIADVILV